MEEVPRHVAAGGVRRMVIGFACGLAVGAIIALVLPRDDLPRRRTLTFDPALDPDADAGFDPGADSGPRAVADGPAVTDAEAPDPTGTARSGELPGA